MGTGKQETLDRGCDFRKTPQLLHAELQHALAGSARVEQVTGDADRIDALAQGHIDAAGESLLELPLMVADTLTESRS